MRCVAACLVWFLAAPAMAHNRDCASKVIDPGVKANCCGLADIHVLAQSDIRYLDSGDVEVRQEGQTHVFKDKEILPGPCAYVWWKRYTDAAITWFCLELPLGM